MASGFLYLIGFVYVVAVAVWNPLDEGRPGQTIGRKVAGVTRRKRVHRPALGTGGAFLRDVAHLADTFLCLVGWFFLLWDASARPSPTRSSARWRCRSRSEHVQVTRSLTRLPGAEVVAAAAALGAGASSAHPRCPLHATTGLWCPCVAGCAAWRPWPVVTSWPPCANVLAVAFAVTGGVWAVRWAGRSVRAGAPVAGLALDARVYRPLAVVLLAFAVIRNLPLGAGLHP